MTTPWTPPTAEEQATLVRGQGGDHIDLSPLVGRGDGGSNLHGWRKNMPDPGTCEVGDTTITLEQWRALQRGEVR